MRVSISPSDIRGRVIAPSSKSYTIRGLMCAALARGTSELVHPLGSDDTDAARDVLTKIGVDVVEDEDQWRISSGGFRAAEGELHCRESATTLRLMTAIAAVVPGESRLTARPSLMKRPFDTLLDALRQLGVSCSFDATTSSITVKGGTLNGGTTSLRGDISSQFVSALLLIAPLGDNDVTIRLTTKLESRPYVDMTVECLNQFGISVAGASEHRQFAISRQEYHPTRYVVEGDWSSASYLLGLGAIGGEIEVHNLNPSSLQADKAIFGFLKDMGVQVAVNPDCIRVSRSHLTAIRADLNDCIDLLPTMAVLAALADGESEFTGISRGRLKESDRVGSIKAELEKAGVEVREYEDRLTIVGNNPRGAVFDSHNDHRIAMALSLLGVVAGNSVIEDAECVAKTYPGYWDMLRNVGGKVVIDGR